MEQYIQTLKKTLETKGLEYFWSICDCPFKIIRDSLQKIQQNIKKDHKKYIGKKFVEIGLFFNEVINKTDWTFAINMTIHSVSDTEPKFADSWKIVLKYTLHDLELHPFNLCDIENLMKIACGKTLITTGDGILYTDFINKLKTVQMKRTSC